MTHLFNTVRFFIAAILIAAFASPSYAQGGPTKIFSLKMSYLSATTYRALYTNETPNGNSTINSATLTAPPGTTFVSPAVPQTTTQTFQVTGYGTNTLNISNIPGIKAIGGTWYIDVKLSGTAAPACSSWNGQAFAGNAFSQPFQLQASLSILSIGLSSSDCTVKLVMSPVPSATVPEGTTSSMTATFTNAATNGATFSAITLTAPSGLSIQTATLPAGTTGTKTTLPGGSVSITNIVPAVSPGGSLAIGLTVKVPSSCTSSSVYWTYTVYAGPTASGQAFATDPASSLATAIAANCNLTFTPNPPKDGISGTTLPSLTVTLNGGTGSDTVVITSSCSGLTGTTSITTTTGSATFTDLKITGADSSCTLTASTTNYGSKESGSFGVFSGIILCGEELSNGIVIPPTASPGDQAIYPPTPPGIGYARGVRGPNKDGRSCTLSTDRIPYVFTNTVIDDNIVTLEWDTNLASYAVFRYQVTFQDEPISTVDGLPKNLTRLFFPDTPGGSKVWHIGVACLSSDYPGKLGTLSAPITVTSPTTIIINGVATVPKSPIAIWVTSLSTSAGGERMKVTQTAVSPVSGAGPYAVTYTVTRGDGLTTPFTHLSGAQVFITPLPVDPNLSLPGGAANPSRGKQVPMCIISEKWEATGGFLLRPTIDVFDVGDGGISRFSE